MSYYHRLIIHFDGASKGNPRGPAGCGWAIYEMNDNGATADMIVWGQKYLGYNVTNNQAEYEGLEAAWDFLNENNVSCNGPYIRGDSEVVINQLDGIYQVKSWNLIGYYDAVMNKLKSVDKNFVKFQHVARSKNRMADELANEAIDYEWTQAVDNLPRRY